MDPIIDEVFNPVHEEPIIGNSKSYIYACGKNFNFELSIDDYKIVDVPSGTGHPRRDYVK